MEWGTFLTVIFALYLAWYGLNFLIDLLNAGKSKIQTEQAVHYNVQDFLRDEEPAQEVNWRDFDDTVVPVLTPVTEKATPEEPTSGGTAPQVTAPAPVSTPEPTPAAQNAPISNPADDWASDIDKEEEIIRIPVQGQPIPVADFIQSFKDNAKSKAAIVFS
jgi:hypothetical protein